MDTQVRTPQQIFNQPQRLLVPLFQRPYVWNKENQWLPLWQDIERVSNRVLANQSQTEPHFFGAVVFQQVQNPIGQLQQRTVIDGQQRLTTLQIFLDALHVCAKLLNQTAAAARILSLVKNPQEYCELPEDQFKIWPTNKDQAAFQNLMAIVVSTESSNKFELSDYPDSRIVLAHDFFIEQITDWLALDGEEKIAIRTQALEKTVRDLLQIVVIDLNANENAQEIFETLNARGSQLTAADLIKNFVFQRLMDSDVEIEHFYNHYWQQFESKFWETEVSVGRYSMPRSSLFLNHWLICQTNEEIVSREVFSRFKTYADYDIKPKQMPELLVEIYNSAKQYKELIDNAANLDGDIDRLGLFVYRTKCLDTEVFKPVVMTLVNRFNNQPGLDDCLSIIESWLVRRMIIKATTKSYNKLMIDVLKLIKRTDTTALPNVLLKFFKDQTSDSSYWPDNTEVKTELLNLPIYRKLNQSKLRVLLEAIEDYRRGTKAGMKIKRGTYAIEHLMPQSWNKHWPLTDDITEETRNAKIHTLGNLTLLTHKLNSSVSNGPWAGEDGKCAALLKHDVLLINQSLKEQFKVEWTESAIEERTHSLIEDILKVWPVPSDHQSTGMSKQKKNYSNISVAQLINAGLLTPGQIIYTAGKKYSVTATLLPNGHLAIGKEVFTSVSTAAKYVTKNSINGWDFWYVDEQAKTPLWAIRDSFGDGV